MMRRSYTHVLRSIIYHSCKVEATQVSISDGWVDKQNVVSPDKGDLFSPRKEGIMTPAMTSMNLEGILQREINQPQKESTV